MIRYISRYFNIGAHVKGTVFENIVYSQITVQYSAKMSETPSEHNDLFQGVTDRYNGITVESRNEQCDEISISKKLTDSLEKWVEDCKRTIWFKVDLKDAHWVPALANNGFNFHHARDNFVMMYKWLPKSESNLPPSAHTNIGVGAIVINDSNQILVVRERHFNYPHWKIPGGYVERGEDIVDAAAREVLEETGIESEFHSLVGFRQSHNSMFGNSDIYIVVHMRPRTSEITKCDREIEICKWMDVDEYLTHPHVHSLGRMIVEKAIDYNKKGIKIDAETITLKLPSFTRDMVMFTIKDLSHL